MPSCWGWRYQYDITLILSGKFVKMGRMQKKTDRMDRMDRMRNGCTGSEKEWTNMGTEMGQDNRIFRIDRMDRMDSLRR